MNFFALQVQGEPAKVFAYGEEFLERPTFAEALLIARFHNWLHEYDGMIDLNPEQERK